MPRPPPASDPLGVAQAVLALDPGAGVDAVTGAYEAALGQDGGRRRALGAFYTPARVVEHLLDLTLEPVLARTAPADLPRLRVGDPTCGAGHFLLGAWRRLHHHLVRAGHPAPASAAAGCLVGSDIDADALVLADQLIRRASGGAPAALRLADSLLEDGPALDVVVGNPPFLNQLESATTATRGRVETLKRRFPGAVSAYTDPAWLHLLAALAQLRPGGRLGLVQPRSLVAARDAAVVRHALATRGTVCALWDGGRVFPGVSVQVVGIVVEARPPDRRQVQVSVGLPPRSAPPERSPDGAAWAPLLPAPPDLPRLPAGALDQPGATTLADHATSAGDFRDEYYGLVPHVVDRAHADERAFPRLITTGYVDPGASGWGLRDTRFARQAWRHPRVDRVGLGADPRMAAWAARRLRPKVLVATQTRAIEAVVDLEGTWLTVTPLLSLYPHRPDRIWHVAAALCSPVVTSWAHQHHGGAALSRDTLKLSAAQLLTVPVPPAGPAWDLAADALARAHAHPAERRDALHAAGRHMLAAWGLPEGALFDGWWRRLGV